MELICRFVGKRRIPGIKEQFGSIYYNSAVGLLTRPRGTGANKLLYEGTAGAVRCVISTSSSTKKEKEKH